MKAQSVEDVLRRLCQLVAYQHTHLAGKWVVYLWAVHRGILVSLLDTFYFLDCVVEYTGFALDSVPEDVTHAGRIGAQRRHDARRHGFPHQIQALKHPRAGEVEIDRIVKNNVDHGEAKG